MPKLIQTHPIAWRAPLVALRSIASPGERYRHARALHGLRVAAAMLATIALTSGIDIPHGIWASVSMLVVIGGLQHQGNIRQKAFERAVGTAIGAVLGLAYVAQYAFLGSEGVTYALLSITAGVCGYYAIGKGGYIALLTAITMCIVAGHGHDSIEIGLWRTANVLIGIGIALAFSFALPLHATYSWRHGVALNLRRSAGVLKRLARGEPLAPEEQVAVFSELSARLVSLRALMPSVAKESQVPLADLENIQRAQRALISALEMLAAAPLTELTTDTLAHRRRFDEMTRAVRRALLGGARDLRNRTAHLPRPWPPAPPIADLPASLQGPYWLVEQLAQQATRLGVALADLRSMR